MVGRVGRAAVERVAGRRVAAVGRREEAANPAVVTVAADRVVARVVVAMAVALAALVEVAVQTRIRHRVLGSLLPLQ